MCIPGITGGILLAMSSQLSAAMDSHPASGSLGSSDFSSLLLLLSIQVGTINIDNWFPLCHAWLPI